MLRIATVRVWRGAAENGSLNDGHRPNVRGERVSLGTGYNHVRGIGRETVVELSLGGGQIDVRG